MNLFNIINAKKSRVIALVLLFIFSNELHANKCISAKKDFKRLYIELQKSLNYEGKDSYLDKNGALKLKPHDKNSPYEGKIFEEALYKEYQNSLRKVAKVYQQNLKSPNSDSFKSNPNLVKFFKSIEDPTGVPANQDLKAIVQDLKKISIENSKDNPSMHINDNDVYLLEKLLTHAQDRLCSVEKFTETGKGTKLFDKDYLQEIKNAPINRLMRSLRDAKITADSDLKLIDQESAINSAISTNINNLRNWMVSNKDCAKVITNPIFIQNNIQNCNYNKFVKHLGSDNFSNLEAILHFVNANERLLNRGQAKAETALDELKLEAYIDQTFANLKNKSSCTEVIAKNGNKRTFVRNLPYDNTTNKFDTSIITCELKGKKLNDKECTKRIQFVSDELGRGLEIKAKNKKDSGLTFSIKDNPECKDLEIVPTPPVITPEEPKNETPPLIIEAPKVEEPKAEIKPEIIITAEPKTEPKPEVVTPTEPKEEPKEEPKSEVKPEKSPEQLCIEKNEKWKEEENEGRPGAGHKWNSEKKTCDDIRKKKDGEVNQNNDLETPEEIEIFPEKKAPGRFTPIQIPTRQMYILPGMP